MKILLVKPYSRSDHIQPSIGLGYLATAVRRSHDVRILDCIKEGVTISRLSVILKRYNPDLIGLQCYTFDVDFVLKALRLAKTTRRDIITVIGGPHPSAAPEEIFDMAGRDLDFLFVGEAEIGFKKLADSIAGPDKDLSCIPGLVWRDGDSLRKNPRAIVDDLDSLGLPAWDMIRPQDYPEAQHGAFFKKFPIAPIMVTRGCPYTCAFCAGGVVSGKKVRRRSAESVLNEISMLYNDFGIREFHVIDDNFTMDKEHIKNILRKLKGLNLDISWSVPNGVRMETLDEEILKLMKETGLYMISLGIESGSDRVLRLMRKNITTEKIKDCVGMIRRSGIDMSGFFILGFPGEDKESILKTISFSTSLGLKRANFFTYLPFPGTESYETLKSNGGLGGIDLKRFYFTNAAFVPAGFTRRRLKAFHRMAFARFYLRPEIIIYHIKTVKSLRHFMFLARRFFRWIIAS